MEPEQPKARQFSRRSFIKTSAGVTAGAAVAITPAAVLGQSGATAQGATPGREVIPDPATGTPQEPVMAYVRNAERGEVTVLSGTDETTYHDPALVKHLLDASQTPNTTGGGLDVLAP